MSLGIYIHLPYCLTKCPYCDFNSYGVGNNFPENDYTEAVLKELELYRGYIDGRELSSIFFGGGTPSLFKSKSIGRIIEAIFEICDVNEDIEITLEINPETTTLGKLREFFSLGVNRASIGIQSFSERKLRFYRRLNTVYQARKVLSDVKRAGFTNFNIDLIYGSYNENLEELESDLEIALEFDSTHISAYCLTIEDGTEFGNLFVQGKLELPSDETVSEMFEFTSDYLNSNGYQHYEISNFSKPGFECLHNLLYWKSKSYFGFGAGAHSHLLIPNQNCYGFRWANVKSPVKYMKMLRNRERPVLVKEKLERNDALSDKIMMGLRLSEGINISEIKKIFEVDFDIKNINHLLDDGFLAINGNTLKLEGKGMLFSNRMILEVVDSIVPKNLN